MNLKKLLMILILGAMAPLTQAGIGGNIGFGVPFLTQGGINYTMGPNWTASIGYYTTSLDSGVSKLEFSMPEAIVQWHPFSGAFYIGLGVGKESLEVSATDVLTGTKVSAKVDAMTTIARLGWMWGKADGGLWFGMDISFISPSSADVEITPNDATLAATKAYKDTESAAEKFGESPYTNITFARLGYLF